MTRKHRVGVALACSVVGVAGRASAQTPPTNQAHDAVGEHRDHANKKLEWHAPRFRASEYLFTGALAVGVGVATMSRSKDSDPNWRGGVLVDDSVIGFARANGVEGRERAAQVSDYLLYSMIAWPYMDAGYVAVGRGSPDAAWQMALVNTQSFALTGLTTTLLKMFVKRERPWVGHCDYESDPSCKGSDSFLSGHTSMTFTSAGLTCAHHQALAPYGNAYADGGACVAALGMASVTGALRIVADKHYTSDVFAGAALGLASGYLLPKLLHYGGFSRSSTGADDHAKKKADTKKVAWHAAPAPVQGGAVMTVGGVFF